MKWNEVRSILAGKLSCAHKPGTKHDMWIVKDDTATIIGRVLDSHGKGEVKSREIGNIARSLSTNEHTFKEIVSCTVSRAQYLAKSKANL